MTGIVIMLIGIEMFLCMSFVLLKGISADIKEINKTLSKMSKQLKD